MKSWLLLGSIIMVLAGITGAFLEINPMGVASFFWVGHF